MNSFQLFSFLLLLLASLTGCDSVDQRIVIRIVVISIVGLIASAATKKKNDKIIEEDANVKEDLNKLINKIKNKEEQVVSADATESGNAAANTTESAIKSPSENIDAAELKPADSTLYGTYTYAKSGCLTVLFVGIFLLFLSFLVGAEDSSIFGFFLVVGIGLIVLWVIMELVYYFKESKNFVYALYMDSIEFYSEPGVLVYVLKIEDISAFTIEYEKTSTRYGDDQISKEIYVFSSKKSNQVYKILVTSLIDKENGISFKDGFQSVLSLYKNRTN